MPTVVSSTAAPWIVTGVAIAYGLYVTLKMRDGGSSGRVNSTVKLDSAKVVDTVNIEDLGDNAVFCRCWKSKKVRLHQVGWTGTD